MTARRELERKGLILAEIAQNIEDELAKLPEADLPRSKQTIDDLIKRIHDLNADLRAQL